MKNLIFWFIFSIIYLKSFGQNKIDQIPDSLKIGANAIILSQSETLEIFSKNKYTHSEKSSILVLKYEENTINKVVIFYDQFIKIENLEITITDVYGKKIKTIKRKDFQDVAYQDGFSIANDSRFLIYDIIGIPTPYIIEKQISSISNQTFSLPVFNPIAEKNIAILKSEINITNHDPKNEIKFYNPTNQKFDSIIENGKQIYSLSLKNLSAIKIKQNDQIIGQNYIRPLLTNFSMENIDGSLISWQEFGNWISHLTDASGELNEEAKSEILSLISNVKDEKEKVEKLYAYLQENMRYVSIQLGIGGWKPMNVQQVHQFKYGDCKALSNYMKHLLKIAGINSKYIIISAGVGENITDTTLVRNQFNHAILAAFPDNDTIFLECTSSKTAPGYQGSFTGNRFALLIDGKNSKLISTKKYTHEDNIIKNEYEINIENQSVVRNQNLTNIGVEYKNIYSNITLSDEKLQNHLTEKSADIGDLKILQKQNIKGINDYNINISTSFISSKKILKTGSRYFIDLNYDKLPEDLILEYKAGKHLKIFNGFTILDHYDFILPNGCYVEKAPKNLDIGSDAGYIQSSSIATDNTKLSYERSIVLKNGHYPYYASDKVSAMMESIKKAYAEKIVVNCKS